MSEGNSVTTDSDKESRAIALYEQKEFDSARLTFDELSKTYTTDGDDKRNCLFNIASCLASEGNYTKAIDILSKIDLISNDLLYNKALCFYKLSRYDEALHCVEKLLANCHEMYPELSIKSDVNLLMHEDIHEPENSEKLRDSCLIEGINLRAAVLFKLKRNLLESKQCLYEVPVKSQELLDCVTLHNQAIYEHTTSLESSINKLAYLSAELIKEEFSPIASLVPEETLYNLLILYMHNGQYEKALKFIEANRDLIEKTISGDTIQFLKTQLERGYKSSDVLVYKKFDKFLDQLLERIKRLGSVDNNDNSETQEIRTRLIELVTIVVTHQGSILWDNNQYEALEKLLIKVAPIIKETDLWKKNMAHTLYMLDTRFEECSRLYEDFLPKSPQESLLKVDPVILGNLCVSYVLTGRNSDAETLIKDVENEELRTVENGGLDNTLSLARQTVSRARTLGKPSHLCVVNLVIGTLYCVKYNFEFGLTRIFKTMDPIERKLHSQTWSQVKRCILALLDSQCKQMICIKDDLFDQIVSFLIQCEKYGILVEVNEGRRLYNLNNLTTQDIALFHGQNSVTYEARHLRSMILNVIHD